MNPLTNVHHLPALELHCQVISIIGTRWNSESTLNSNCLVARDMSSSVLCQIKRGCAGHPCRFSSPRISSKTCKTVSHSISLAALAVTSWIQSQKRRNPKVVREFDDSSAQSEFSDIDEDSWSSEFKYQKNPPRSRLKRSSLAALYFIPLPRNWLHVYIISDKRKNRRTSTHCSRGSSTDIANKTKLGNNRAELSLIMGTCWNTYSIQTPFGISFK